MPKKARSALLTALAALILLVPAGATLQGGSPATLPCSGTRSGAILAAAWFPADGQLQWQAGKEALGRGEWGQAICYLKKAQALLEPSASLGLDLGDALKGSGDLPAAMQNWAAALALEPRSDPALQRLREAYESSGQWQHLEEVLQAWMALHPQDLSAENRLAEVTAALDPQQARQFLGGLEQGGRMPSQDLAQLLTTIQAAEEQGGSVYAYARVGELLIQREDWALAQTALQEAVKQNPAYGQAFAYLGYALEQSRQPAQWAYQRAVLLSPQDGTAHLLYGSYLARQGEIAQAREELQRSWDLGPKDALIASQLGALEYSAGNLIAAQQWYAEGVQLFPNEEEAWIAQAEFYLGHDLQVMETGIPAARQAAILAPDDPQSVDLLGFGWFLMGDLPTAERLFWKALDQDPTYVPALFHLGMVAESRGDLHSAVGFYQKVAALDPQGPMAQPARDRIERIGILR